MGSAPSQDAETVVLDLMNPLGPDWRLFCRAGKTWLEGSFPACQTPPDFVVRGHSQ
jgi:hypothetical protein